MRKTLLIQSALGAAMLTFAGTALAADPAQPGRADGMRNEAPAEIDRTRNTDTNTPGMPNDAAKPTAPPNSIVGLNVVNAEGEEIGEVAGVDGHCIGRRVSRAGCARCRARMGRAGNDGQRRGCEASDGDDQGAVEGHAAI